MPTSTRGRAQTALRELVEVDSLGRAAPQLTAVNVETRERHQPLLAAAQARDGDVLRAALTA